LSSSPGVKFAELPSISGVGSRLRSSADAKRRLRELVKSSDLVIARLPSELGLLAARIAKAEHKPLATEIVGSGFGALWNHGPQIYKFYAPFFDYRVRRAVRLADAGIYVTRRALQEQYPCPGITGHASN